MKRWLTRSAAIVALSLLAACSAGPGPGDASGTPLVARSRASVIGEVVWASVELGDRIVKVDVRTQEILRTFRAPAGPHNITAAPDGTVVASLYGSDQIELIRRGRVVRVDLGGRPHDVKIARNLVVVTNEGAARLDLVSLDGSRRGRVPLQADPHDVAVEPGGRRAWVTLDGDGRLAVVNLVTRHVRYVVTGRRPHDLLFAPNGRLFVTDWGGALMIFSRSGALVASRPLGDQAHHLAFTPGGRQVWVTDNALDRVFVVATSDLHVIARKRFPGAPHHVAITPDGRFAVVADHTRGSLVVYRVSTRRIVGTIAVGPGPHGVWAAPSG